MAVLEFNAGVRESGSTLGFGHFDRRIRPVKGRKNRLWGYQYHSSDKQRSDGNKPWYSADQGARGRGKKSSDGDEPWVSGD